MPAHERVTRGQRGRHAAGLRREARGDAARVDPHDPVGEAREALHLAPDERRVAALPAVGDDHDDRAARHPAAAEVVVEALQRRADLGAPGPVRGGSGGARERELGLVAAQRPRDPRQARGEDERLRVRATDGAVQELQERPRVGLHGAGDVAEDDQAPRALDALTPQAPDRVAAGAVARAQRRAQVQPAVAEVAPRPPRAARGRGERQGAHQHGDRGELLGRQRAEVLVRQAFTACRARHRRVTLGRLLAPAAPLVADPRARFALRPVERTRARGSAAALRLGALHRRVLAAGVGGVDEPVEEPREDGVEGRELLMVGDEDRARGAVERPARARRREQQRAGKAHRALGRRRQAGVAQRATGAGGDVREGGDGRLSHRRRPPASRDPARERALDPRGT